MLLGILSDTHDQLDRTRRGVDLLREQGVSALVHCGDLTTPEVLEICAVLPCWFVLGNNDTAVERLRQTAAETGAVCLDWGGLLPLAGRQIGVTHGHRRGEWKRLLAAEPDYLLFGHTHRSGDNRVGPTRRINPGALHRAWNYSVAVLDVVRDEVRYLNVPR
jgi:putative phosphoesterase